MTRALFIISIICLLASSLVSADSRDSSTKDLLRDSQSESLNLQPVIGVIATPSAFDEFPAEKYNYIPASYVKFVQAAGSRVVPIPWDLDDGELSILLSKLNGVLIPSSMADIIDADGLTHFGRRLQIILNKVIEFNDNGIHYPIWGISSGYQAIACIISGQRDGNYSCLTQVEGLTQVSKNITFTTEGADHQMFAKITPAIREALLEGGAAYFNSADTLRADLWHTSPEVSDSLVRLAYTEDQEGNQVTALVAGLRLPIYGSQFHPEKNQFEWGQDQEINHSYESVQASQLFANFFVNEARRNFNTFDESGIDLEALLIYNYNAVQVTDSSFEQIYFLSVAGPDAETRTIITSA